MNSEKSADLSQSSLIVGTIPSELETIIEKAYIPAGIKTLSVHCETESAEYKACRFSIGGKIILFRVAKTTAKKIGQFVTIWKRVHATIKPIDTSDGVEFVVVSVSNEENHGQFVFSKAVLVAQSIMSHESKRGKLAIRVYPPWSNPTSKQAIATQDWQLQYFSPVILNETTERQKIRNLFNL
jgi:hypothetical protein